MVDQIQRFDHPWCKGKTLMGFVNKLLKTKRLLTSPSYVLPSLPQVNFPAHNLNFHWKWRWWDWIQTTISNNFYFTDEFLCLKNLIINPWFQAAIKAKYGLDATAVGDEGGFAPNFQNNKVILFQNRINNPLENINIHTRNQALRAWF